MFRIFHELIIGLHPFFTWYSQPGQLIAHVIGCALCCGVILLIIRGLHA